MKLELAQIDLNAIQHQGLPGSNFSPTGTTIGAIINAAIPYIFAAAGMLLLVYLIFGGIQLMLSQGEPKAAQAARANISNALIGFIIVFFAYWVVQLFALLLGLTKITQIFGGR